MIDFDNVTNADNTSTHRSYYESYINDQEIFILGFLGLSFVVGSALTVYFSRLHCHEDSNKDLVDYGSGYIVL